MFEPIKKKPMKLIIELEKIKADLLNLEFNFHYDWATTKHIIEIIDNHISELKGE